MNTVSRLPFRTHHRPHELSRSILKARNARTLLLAGTLTLLPAIGACTSGSSGRAVSDVLPVADANPAATPNPTAPAARTGAEVCATILSTNDTHGQLLPRTFRWTGEREAGGAAVMAAYFGSIRDTADCPVFLLSAGDIMQGTAISNLLEGTSTIAAFNAMGYDAAALGNHEFDWGIGVLRERMAQAEFPVLGANVFERSTGRHPEWLYPTRMLERDGVRIGVVGLATRSTPTTTRPWNVSELEFRSISSALDVYVPRLRAAGADFVIAVMHAGGFCRDEICEGEAFDELRAASELPDYAVTGHTHSFLDTSVRGVPIVQSRSSTAAFGVGRLRRGPDGQVSARVLEVRNAYVDEVVPDPDVAALVEGYRAATAEIADQPVDAELAEDLPRVRGSGSGYPLGRLIADAQRGATEAQVAIMNNGGIRTGLSAGRPAFGDLLAVQPFGNVLVRLTLSGSDLLAALEHSVADGTPDAHVSGLVARYSPEAPAGRRLTAVRLDSGEAVTPEGSYTVTVNDFMAGGGSGFDMFGDPLALEVTGIVDLDALIDWLESRPQPVSGPRDRRWIQGPGA